MVPTKCASQSGSEGRVTTIRAGGGSNGDIMSEKASADIMSDKASGDFMTGAPFRTSSSKNYNAGNQVRILKPCAI